MGRGSIAAPLVAAGLLAGAPAWAQFAKPEDAVRYRKAAMTMLGSHVGRLGPVVRGDRPFDAADVQANVAVVETLSKLAFDGFVPGTEHGGGTRAKHEVWSQADRFRARTADFQKAVAALSTAAKAGQPDGVKAAYGEVGRACKACHDDFQGK